MRPKSRNPWNQASVRAYGEQLRRLEKEAEQTPTPARERLWTSAALASAALVAVVAVIVLVFPSGRSAQARNVVNETPAAAEHAGSLRFRSVLSIKEDGRSRPGISEEGAIDFLTGNYATTMRFASNSQRLERRRVEGTLYASRGPVAQRPGEQTRWDAAPIRKGSPGGFASESDAFTDPPAVFRSLARISAPVVRMGRERVNGVPTTLYELRTNLAALLAPNAGHVQDPSMYRGVRATLEVWIDRQGRPRQVEETFTSGASSLSTVVQFSGYGQAVLVHAPPKSLVRPTRGAVRPNPLGAGPGPLLAPLLFFNPGKANSPARHAPRTTP
jgi:hypothetical protein